MQFYNTIKTLLQQKSSLFLMIFGLFLFSQSMTSCGTPKTGCPVNEQAKTKVNKKGELSGKKGKSNLFPKKVRKKLNTK